MLGDFCVFALVYTPLCKLLKGRSFLYNGGLSQNAFPIFAPLFLCCEVGSGILVLKGH